MTFLYIYLGKEDLFPVPTYSIDNKLTSSLTAQLPIAGVPLLFRKARSGACDRILY